jgi:hypothetical protein
MEIPDIRSKETEARYLRSILLEKIAGNRLPIAGGQDPRQGVL